jgi:hypothetical protein
MDAIDLSPPFAVTPAAGGMHHETAASIARRYARDRRLIERNIDYEGAISNRRRLH